MYSNSFHWFLTFYLDISSSFSRSRLIIKLYHILVKFFKLLSYTLQLLLHSDNCFMFLLFLLYSNTTSTCFRFFFFTNNKLLVENNNNINKANYGWPLTILTNINLPHNTKNFFIATLHHFQHFESIIQVLFFFIFITSCNLLNLIVCILQLLIFIHIYSHCNHFN